MGDKSGRQVLPDNVKPTNYSLTIETDLVNFNYSGKVAIQLEFVKDSYTVAVNSLELIIHDVLIMSTSEFRIQSPIATTYDTDLQATTFTFPFLFAAGSKEVLTMSYTGKLTDGLAGYYRSSYEEGGVTKYIATTQMEPTDARRAVPCFDQPDLKATWDVTQIADEKLICLGNMDIKHQVKVAGGKKMVTFNRTPKMSTYLLAFAVGDLIPTEDKQIGIPVRLNTIRGKETEAKFATDLAAKTIAFYEKAFGIKYPLKKMDMIALPDFVSSAMENWGLITFREAVVLFDEKEASIARKQFIAEVVQHELAHQWFGNLVTMEWWDGLWLNEGFATWMSWYSQDTFYKEWKVMESYVTDTLEGALTLDGLRHSHPIEVPVKRIDEINQIFDQISYLKGSSVLRMLWEYLGKDDFLKGVNLYLEEHKYGNTQTSDLWTALGKASGKDVAKTMATWTKEIGHPVITVKEDGKKLTLIQNRYLRTGDPTPDEDKTLWNVFVALRTDGKASSLSFDTRETTIQLDNADFFKINANQTGVYRTLYTPERFTKFGAQAHILSVQDRAGIIADACAVAEAGYRKTSGLLNLIYAWKAERECTPLTAMAQQLSNVNSAWLFEPEDQSAGIKKFQQELFAPVAHEVGWDFPDGDTDIVKQKLKVLAFREAGLSGDGKVVTAAKEMFAKFSSGVAGAIHPNLRAAVFAIVLTYGDNHGEKEWDVIKKASEGDRGSDASIIALQALGNSQNSAKIQETLSIALQGKGQDVAQTIASLHFHAPGVKALWDWLTKKWDKILEKNPPDGTGLLSIIETCTGGFTTDQAVKDIETFFQDKDTKGYKARLDQSKEGVTAKAKWVRTDREDVKAWLKNKG